MPKVRLVRQVTGFDAAGRQVILQPGEHEVSEAEAAHYRARGWCIEPPLKGARKAPEPAPTPELVAIPSDWRKLHHLQMAKIAKAISGGDVTSKAAAAEIITEEIARRKRQEEA